MNEERRHSESVSTDAVLDWLLAKPGEKSASVQSEPPRGFLFRHGTLWVGAALVGVFLVALTAYPLLIRAPGGFAAGSDLSVKEGMTMQEVADVLYEKKLIRSPAVFKMFGILWDGTQGIKAGEYYFAEPISVVALSWRLTHGKFNLVPVRVTIPEGFNNRQIAATLAKVLPRFHADRFLSLAASREGYLFPDTYNFLPSTTEREVIEAMEQTLTKRLAPLTQEMARFGKPLRAVMIMASFLEEEARTEESRRKIAGILWKRLEAKMPLQVDAVFPYIFGDRPFDLTNGDLFVDSPYNTYKYAGLPPGPISNPGAESIRAAMTPIATPYWYYLSDRDGEMHYAVTHEEHLRNRAAYVGK